MTLDLGDRQVQRRTCAGCGREYDRVVIFATRNEDAYAVVSAVCHGHPDTEVWVDATLGSWEEPFADHVTLSCRISPAGARLVDAPVAGAGEAAHYGSLLTRSEALDSPRLGELWALVDAIVTTVPEAARQIYRDEG